MDRIGKYEDLYNKYVMLENHSTRSEDQEAVEAEFVVMENEMKILRIKLGKEREKVKYLDRNYH